MSSSLHAKEEILQKQDQLIFVKSMIVEANFSRFTYQNKLYIKGESVTDSPSLGSLYCSRNMSFGMSTPASIQETYDKRASRKHHVFGAIFYCEDNTF